MPNFMGVVPQTLARCALNRVLLSRINFVPHGRNSKMADVEVHKSLYYGGGRKGGTNTAKPHRNTYKYRTE